jgi:hypothetical protein
MESKVSNLTIRNRFDLGPGANFAQAELIKSFSSMSNISMQHWKTSAIVTGLASLSSTGMPEVDA